MEEHVALTPELLGDSLTTMQGQVVRLMWEDAGIAYEDVRYSNEELPDAKEGFFARTNPAKTLPIIELNGKILTQSYAILRHFSRLLGKYDGETEESKYFVDAVCDIGIDCKSASRSIPR